MYSDPDWLAIEKLGRDDPVGTFTHDGREYSLSKVRYLLHNAPSFVLPISKLVWVLDHDTPSEERIALSKLRYPLFVTRDQRSPQSKETRWTVVDGLHRLEKYRRKGIRVVPCKLVTQAILDRSLIHD